MLSFAFEHYFQLLFAFISRFYFITMQHSKDFSKHLLERMTKTRLQKPSISGSPFELR